MKNKFSFFFLFFEEISLSSKNKSYYIYVRSIFSFYKTFGSGFSTGFIASFGNSISPYVLGGLR